MNKKLKKMFAMVSALAVCSVSVISTCANAYYFNYSTDTDITKYTISFTLKDDMVKGGSIKYNFWQEATDFYNEGHKIFLSEPIIKIDPDTGKESHSYRHMLFVVPLENDFYINPGCSAKNIAAFHSKTEKGINSDKIHLVEEYLKNNSIPYYFNDNFSGYVTIDVARANPNMSLDELLEVAVKIKEYSGWHFIIDDPMASTDVEILSVENALPEPTLTGDANEDGNITIADSVLILQSLSSPDDYKLTIQGIANADMDGDGVTAADALRIQEMLANK